MVGRRKQSAEERSAQERAAAAAQRMRRRGVEPPTELAQTEVPVRPPEPEPAAPQPAPEPAPVPEAPAAPQPGSKPEPEPTAAAAPQPDPEPPAAVAPQPKPEPEPEPEPRPPTPAPAVPPPATAAGRPQMPLQPAADTPAEPVRAEPESWLDPDPEPAPAAPDAGALRRGPRPAPPRREGAPARRPAPPRPKGRRGGPPPSAPRRPLPPSARPPSRAGRRIATLLAALVVVALAYVAVRTFQPFHADPTGSVRVTVPAGAGAGQIGDLLARKGVVDSGRFFSINATLTGRRGDLKSGEYTLQRDMTYGAALDALETGPKAKVVKTFKLTLPEGLSRREMAPRVKRGGVRGDYLKATGSAMALRTARALGLPRSVNTTEGFLFPATYDLVSGAKASTLVAKQLAAYRDQTAGVSYQKAKAKNLTRYDVLIIASMVERETQLDRERPLVAAVIYNRLKDGMPLGIDATIRYAERNWTRPLRVSELERPGPYNTRLNRGLPPTPIGNPGLASIKAAANPAKVSYRYYVVKPGTNGHAFSSTDAQFERDRQRYDAARAANGGKSPTP